MTDDKTLAVLAECLQRWSRTMVLGQGTFTSLTRMAEAADAVSTRLLDLLPPSDDGELVTNLWLNGLSGRGWCYVGYSLDIGPLEFEPRADDVDGPVELHPHHTGLVLATRGHVRRLCQVLGITLKEVT